MVNHLLQFLGKFVEVFLVNKQLMSLITVSIKALFTFSNRDVVIIPPGCSHIKEIRPASSSAYLP